MKEPCEEAVTTLWRRGNEALQRAMAALVGLFDGREPASIGEGRLPTAISTGLPALDDALVIGGYPRGRLSEIAGPESCGKTTLALHAVAHAQECDETAAWLDIDGGLDIRYARALGVRVDELLMSRPAFGEQGLQIACILAGAGGVDVLVIDSVAALVPRSELGRDLDGRYDDRCSMLRRWFPLLTRCARAGDTAVLLLERLVGSGSSSSSLERSVTGGSLQEACASLRLALEPRRYLASGSHIAGTEVEIFITKSVFGYGRREVCQVLRFGDGFLSQPRLDI